MLSTKSGSALKYGSEMFSEICLPGHICSWDTLIMYAGQFLATETQSLRVDQLMLQL